MGGSFIGGGGGEAGHPLGGFFMGVSFTRGVIHQGGSSWGGGGSFIRGVIH